MKTIKALTWMFGVLFVGSASAQQMCGATQVGSFWDDDVLNFSDIEACDGQSYKTTRNGLGIERYCVTETGPNGQVGCPIFPDSFRVGITYVFGTGRTELNCIYDRTLDSPCAVGEFQGNECIIDNTFACRKSIEECTLVGNPIDYKYGVKHESKLDYSSGGEFPLTILRRYRSDASLTEAWKFNFSGVDDRELFFPGDGEPGTVIAVKSADGSVEVFESFTSDSDVVATFEPITNGWRYISANDQVQEFDLLGRLVYIENIEGQSISYVYDELSVSVTDDFGRSLVVTNNILGQPVAVRLPNGQSITYSYSSAGLLEFVNYPDGSSLQYHYDENRLSGITDERGVRYANFAYDSSGKAVLTEHIGGVGQYTFSYDQSVSTVTNPLGKVTEHEFIEIQGAPKRSRTGRLASEHCGASASSYDYDGRGFVASEIDWQGNRREYLRDSRGLSTQTIFAEGTPEQQVLSTQWHGQYRIPEVITEPGRQTTYTFTPYENPNYTKKTVSDLNTGEFREWSYTYNDFGQLTFVDGPRDDVTDQTSIAYYDCDFGAECGQVQSVTNGLGHTVTYDSYDEHGYPTQFTDANGIVTTMTYDLRQRLASTAIDGFTTIIDYDPTGEVSRVTQPDGTYLAFVRDDANRLIGTSDGQGNRIEWTLDNAGNRVAERFVDPAGQIRKSLQYQYDELSRMRGMVYAHGGVYSYEFDANGNQIKQVDPSSRESRAQFDALDRIIKDIDAISGETTYSYDARDNLISVTDPEGIVTAYQYSGFDELQLENSADSGTTNFVYDKAGNIQQKTDARGVTATFEYDALNRLTSIAYPDSSENVSYEYDQGINGVGRLTRISDVSGSTEYAYDGRGNITQVIQIVSGQTYTLSYRYNGANRLTGMTYPDGRDVSITYDSSGRVLAMSGVSDAESEVLATDIERLPFGPIVSMTMGNGIERTRTYDQDYRVTNLEDGSILSRNYGYSPVNNIIAITDGVTPAASQFFDYDNLDRLTFATGDYGEQTFTYDGVGNRLSLLDEASGGSNASAYVYEPASHRLSSIVGGRIFTYDAAGNSLNNGEATFTYSDRNRMNSVLVDGVTTTYLHNALGQRVSKARGDVVTHYIYDLGGRLIAEADGSSGLVQVAYAYLDGEPLVMWRDDSAEPTTPGVVIPTNPIDTVSTSGPSFMWDADPTADEYQVIVHDRFLNERVLNERYFASDVCVNDVCTITPDVALNFSVNHFWRIRGRNAQGWGEWTDPIRFDYLDDIPDPVTPNAPISSTDLASPVFEWQDVGNALEYQVLIYDRFLQTQVFNDRVNSVDVCSASTCTLIPQGVTLNYSPNHFWRVRARNSGGWSQWTDPIRFDYVDAIPEPISSVSPIGDITTSEPSYVWQDVGNAIEYQVLIHDRFLRETVFNERLLASEVCSAGNCSNTPQGIALNFSANHFWRIRARNSGGWNEWSDPIRFNYLDIPPAAPAAIGPTGTLTTANPMYEWTPEDNALEYQLIIRDQVLQTIIYNERHVGSEVCSETVCGVTPTTATLSDGNNHFWRVRGMNSGGWGEWMSVQRFNVDTGGR